MARTATRLAWLCTSTRNLKPSGSFYTVSIKVLSCWIVGSIIHLLATTGCRTGPCWWRQPWISHGFSHGFRWQSYTLQGGAWSTWFHHPSGIQSRGGEALTVRGVSRRVFQWAQWFFWDKLGTALEGGVWCETDYLVLCTTKPIVQRVSPGFSKQHFNLFGLRGALYPHDDNIWVSRSDISTNLRMKDDEDNRFAVQSPA